MGRLTAVACAAILAGGAGLVACGDDGNEELVVLLSEWIVQPDSISVTAGDIDITADNQGGEIHELVIVRGSAPAELPLDENGAVDEAQLDERDFIGEIEEFPAQEERTETFTLNAADYILFCNVVEVEESGEVESHYAEGMVATLTVTE